MSGVESAIIWFQRASRKRINSVYGDMMSIAYFGGIDLPCSDLTQNRRMAYIQPLSHLLGRKHPLFCEQYCGLSRRSRLVNLANQRLKPTVFDVKRHRHMSSVRCHRP